MKKVFVAASEGCGNNLLRRVLSLHPELGEAQVGGTSISYARMGFSDETFKGEKWAEEWAKGSAIWLTFEDLDTAEYTILQYRSPVHAAYSTYKRYASWTRGETPEAKIELILWYQLSAFYWIKMAARSHRRVLVTCYEMLVENPERALGKIAAFLCLKQTSWDWSKLETEPFFVGGGIQNRNDDRWKSDPVFVKVWERYWGLFEELMPYGRE